MDRRPLLETETARRLFVEALGAARARHHFDIWAYVIMPEHVHLLIWPRQAGYNISTILAGVKRPVAYRAREAGLLEGPHFWLPGGGFDSNLVKAGTVMAEVDYIHRNPVRRGLCQRPEEWRYSSAGFWAGQTDVPLAMDRTLPALGG
jgi:putative transposase